MEHLLTQQPKGCLFVPESCNSEIHLGVVSWSAFRMKAMGFGAPFFWNAPEDLINYSICSSWRLNMTGQNPANQGESGQNSSFLIEFDFRIATCNLFMIVWKEWWAWNLHNFLESPFQSGWISSRLIVNMQKGELHPVAWRKDMKGPSDQNNLPPALNEWNDRIPSVYNTTSL